MSTRERIKPAILAMLVMLPLLFGVGWVADLFTRASLSMIVVSNGDAVPDSLRESLLPGMVPLLLLMWLVTGVIVVGLAAIGLPPGPRLSIVPPPPPPPPPPSDDSERSPS